MRPATLARPRGPGPSGGGAKSSDGVAISADSEAGGASNAELKLRLIKLRLVSRVHQPELSPLTEWGIIQCRMSVGLRP